MAALITVRLEGKVIRKIFDKEEAQAFVDEQKAIVRRARLELLGKKNPPVYQVHRRPTVCAIGFQGSTFQESEMESD